MDNGKNIKLTGKRFSVNQKILIAAPPALLLSTWLIFTMLVPRLGLKAGYFSGFLFYWLFWCLLFPLFLLGKKNFSAMFCRAAKPFTDKKWSGLIMLFAMPLFTLFYALPIQLPKATPIIVLASLGIAAVNAFCEEVLWRGTYFMAFPKNLRAGYLYPAVWFGLWHYAPQSVVQSSYPGGAHSLVLFAFLLGLMWGWVAWKTRSIRWTVIAHLILNFAGLGALFYFS